MLSKIIHLHALEQDTVTVTITAVTTTLYIVCTVTGASVTVIATGRPVFAVNGTVTFAASISDAWLHHEQQQKQDRNKFQHDSAGKGQK